MRKRVLWGHHVSEYQEMFDVSDAALEANLLEYGCGASAVNAELHQAGTTVVSIDPLFALSKPELVQHVNQDFDERVQQVLADQAQFNVESYGGMEAFLATRRAGMEIFFADYNAGIEEGRYKALVSGALPFENFSFDLALSSHYLFANAADDAIAYHVKTIQDLARVAKEVRIFPLIERAGTPSELLGPVLLGLQQANFGTEVREVRCALYPEGNAMLRVWAQACDVER
ncbi:MAG: class I SAM-dependent methyltransferase [Legionella sp.]|jgi:hypothetical protein|nr:class I SAM-dependent methyltransferase [Legionella sp.]